MSKRKPTKPTAGEFARANPPGLYPCPHCGELLSGPARYYTCPKAPSREVPDGLPAGPA